MKKEKFIFMFDLDSTITKEEILPTIAKKNKKEKKMREITEKTMMGDLLFEESFKARVDMLKDIPVSEVAEMVSNIRVNEKLVKFLKENKENCYIVTSNLDVWISKLMEKIGMQDHYFSSKAEVKDDHIIKINSILSKEDVVRNCKEKVVAVGDGSNDRMMLDTAHIGIGFGGVRDISPVLMDVIDYAIYDEEKLYEFLKRLAYNETKDDKTIVISCAGMGKRLGMGIPKALVEIDDKALIIRNLEMLNNCNDVRIVVGYKAIDVIERVISYRKDITFVFNNDYMNNGTGASVTLAAKYANKYILTIDGDLLVHPEDMTKILNEKEEFIGVCKASTDNPVLTSIENEKVVEFSRERGQFEWTGVSLTESSKLFPGEGHVYQLIEPLLPVKYLLIRTKEIDTRNDYLNAERWVKNNFSDNLTIGIIGGMGSYATVDFFRRLIDAFPAEKEWERPRIIIDNRCNMPSRVRAILYNERRNELVKSLAESVQMMLSNNVDYIVLACNTSHVFLKDLYDVLPECKNKIIHIIDQCAREVKKAKKMKVRLYASEGTIQSKIYDKIFSRYNIEILKPSKKEYTQIREWIECVKTNNITKNDIESFLVKINEEKETPIILGCTELPIMYSKCKREVEASVFDPLESVINYLIKAQKDRNL